MHKPLDMREKQKKYSVRNKQVKILEYRILYFCVGVYVINFLIHIASVCNYFYEQYN